MEGAEREGASAAVALDELLVDGGEYVLAAERGAFRKSFRRVLRGEDYATVRRLGDEFRGRRPRSVAR